MSYNLNTISNILGLPVSVVEEMAQEYFELYETAGGFLEDTQEALKDYEDSWSFLIANQRYKSVQEYILKNLSRHAQ